MKAGALVFYLLWLVKFPNCQLLSDPMGRAFLCSHPSSQNRNGPEFVQHTHQSVLTI